MWASTFTGRGTAGLRACARHGGGEYPALHTERKGDPVVIVAAHNEADRIGATLDALGRAFPGAEVVVADDASTDGTVGAWRWRAGPRWSAGVGRTARART